MKQLFKTLLLLILLVSCAKEKKIGRAFYYWKSVFSISSSEANTLRSLGVKKLYVKFFDVTWKEEKREAVSEAVINWASKSPAGIEVVPTVFISNQALLRTRTGDIEKLANNVHRLIQSVAVNHSIPYSELLFDCDWTDSTRVKYFALLSKIRELEKKNVILSATIRLHQVKYVERTGVPPVTRGMLMFYNMGKLNDPRAENSIYNEKDARNYIEYVKNYPLPLDVALPAFTWAIHFRNNDIKHLLNNVPAMALDTCRFFDKKEKNYFVANDNFFFHGDYFMKYDLVKVEEISPDICLKSAGLVSSHLNTDSFSVSLFHFDNSNPSRYETHDIKNIYNCFH